MKPIFTRIKAMAMGGVVAGLVLARRALVFAQDGGGDNPPIQLPNAFTGTDIPTLLTRLLNQITTYIAPPIAVLMVIIGAFMILTAGGDPEKVKRGRFTLLWTAVGFAIILGANLIMKLINELIGPAS